MDNKEKEFNMKRLTIVVATGMFVFANGMALAQVAGRAPLGITVEQTDAIISGWSAKKAILGKVVLNDQNKKIGKIDDIIITPDNSVSYAIIGTGGFVGLGKHDVAIPIGQIQMRDDNFVLPGATKDALKALPAFQYTRTHK
jgi:sporulation protein YlmC with PRC-barrel domain